MPRARQIKMTNGDLEGFVLKESVDAWERNGWTVADDESSEQEAAEVTDKPLETQAEVVEGDETAPAPAPAKKTTTRKAD